MECRLPAPPPAGTPIDAWGCFHFFRGIIVGTIPENHLCTAFSLSFFFFEASRLVGVPCRKGVGESCFSGVVMGRVPEKRSLEIHENKLNSMVVTACWINEVCPLLFAIGVPLAFLLCSLFSPSFPSLCGGNLWCCECCCLFFEAPLFYVFTLSFLKR